jgi:hypothetical protein
MRTIRISEQTYKEIAKRGKFGETPNDFLERVFKITKTKRKNNRRVLLPPDNTECRFKRNGEYVFGQIKNGKLILPIGSYSAFSTAAKALTGTNLNGWLYWEIKLPKENQWILANSWRRMKTGKASNLPSDENIPLPWFQATLNAVRRFSKRHNTKTITLKNLVREELDNVINDTKTRGKTPIYTFQFYLQKLRDSGHIEFIDNQGTYLLME